MPVSRTLRDITGMGYTPASVRHSALVLIDCQNTYREGMMQLEGVEPALVECQSLLNRYRNAGRPVIHIQHDAGPGTPYDVHDSIGAIADIVAPREGEPVVVKNYPSSFEKTNLDQLLKGYGVEELALVGFMTHVCVNSTARAAFNHGYRATVVGNATARGRFPIRPAARFRPRNCTRRAWRRSTIFLQSSCRPQTKFRIDGASFRPKTKSPA